MFAAWDTQPGWDLRGRKIFLPEEQHGMTDSERGIKWQVRV